MQFSTAIHSSSSDGWLNAPSQCCENPDEGLKIGLLSGQRIYGEKLHSDSRFSSNSFANYRTYFENDGYATAPKIDLSGNFNNCCVIEERPPPYPYHSRFHRQHQLQQQLQRQRAESAVLANWTNFPTQNTTTRRCIQCDTKTGLSEFTELPNHNALSSLQPHFTAQYSEESTGTGEEMSHIRSGSYRHNEHTQGAAVSASTMNFGSSDDLFVNFNEKLQQLPELQRDMGEKLRRHLQFFFMNPLQKYRIRQQFPFKLVLQILKVVFITIQLILFAELRISHVDFLDDTVTVMRHKFLKDWSNEQDEVSYPPDSSKYAVFSSDQIIQHVSYIVKSYYTIQNGTFASFSYDDFTHPRRRHTANEPLSKDEELEPHFEFSGIPPMQLCRDRIADVTIQNDTYVFDISEVNECFFLNFSRSDVDVISRDPFAIRDMLASRNVTFKQGDALIMSKVSIKFNLRTIHFSPLSTDQKPECYKIKITIDFDNSRHTGQVFIRLNTIISYVNLCNGRVLQVGSVSLDTVFIGIIDVIVLILCIFSLLLCCRALIKAHLLKNTTCDFFESVFKRRVSLKDQLEFVNLWYVMIVVNDILIILGTIFKVTIEFRDFDSDLFTLTGILLGLGALLVYIGLLRYLGFFNEYNILVLTLKKSLPSILRFMVCTIILYMGFLIAGWVIIGPYSIKFRTLAQSSEALFSLLNGDDMFATFYTISDSSTTIKVFGTIYIYVFVCLFIYIVLSLFIAIIMDAYEVVKEHYNQGLEVEHSTLFEFLASAEPPNESSSEARELFSADRLLRLDDNWLLQNWSEICDSIGSLWRRTVSPSGRPRATANRQRVDDASSDTNFDYRHFDNPVSDGVVLSPTRRGSNEAGLPAVNESDDNETDGNSGAVRYSQFT